jgi:hypothetical protein
MLLEQPEAVTRAVAEFVGADLASCLPEIEKGRNGEL